MNYYKTAEDSTLHFYRTNARQYFLRTHNLDVAALRKKLECYLNAGSCILDLGCGSGRDARHFQQRHRVVGVDYSHELATLARGFSGVPIICADMRYIPLCSTSFNAVWALGSFIHIPTIDLTQALSEVTRILKPDGLFFAAVKNGTGEEIDSLGRYNVYYSRDEWAEIINTSGITLLDIDIVAEHRPSSEKDSGKIEWIVSLSRVH